MKSQSASEPLLPLRCASRRSVRADILEQVLVKVNGDIITKTDLETRQIAAIRGRINSQVDADALKNDAQLKQMLAEVTPRILVDAIDELLMIQLGKEKGYRATDQQFKDWVADSARTRTSKTSRSSRRR